MSEVDFEVDFNISKPPDDASADELRSWDAMKLSQRANKAEAKCAELEKMLAKHTVRASSLSAMKDEASRAWVRIGELERKCGELERKNAALGRANEDLEEKSAELRRRLAHRASNTDLAQAQACIERTEARCAKLEKELAKSKAKE